MAYNPNIPQPNNLLSTSQGDILNNFGAANTVYGVDHYAFDDTTPNATFHKKVTTPPLNAHPNADTNTIFYSFQDAPQIGPIQYSKGKTRVDQSNQVSTPLTWIQSSQTPIVLTNNSTSSVLDFTGITRAFAVLTAGNFSSSSSGCYSVVANVMWCGAVPIFSIIQQNFVPPAMSGFLSVTQSGNILLIRNNLTGNTLNNIFWTLQFIRIEI